MIGLNKNDKIEAVIETLGYKGEGIARLDRVPVFINGALPGEKVRALIILVKKDFAVGKLLEVLSPSPLRVAPGCPVFGKCGGCDLQHLAYGEQLGFKKRAVEDALAKIAHIRVNADDCVPSPCEYGYRNKISMPVRKSAKGASAGFFAYNSHRIVETDDCPLQTEKVRKLMPALRVVAERFAPYDEESGKGELRHFSVRDLGGRISLTAVVTRDVRSRIIRAVKDCGADVDELWQNVNRTRGNVIMGDSSELILGERKPYNYCGLELYVHPNGFLQVNSGVAEKLYAKISELASRANVDRIIDAYSGSGVLTAMLSGSAKEVIGVEIERAAVDSADELMRGNGIANVRNICGDCADVIPRLLSGGGTEKTLIVLDPPRGGCDAKVINAVNSCGAEEVIYVSCNPSTLARDLAMLTSYNVASVTPFDMFPQTKHVETLVHLSNK